MILIIFLKNPQKNIKGNKVIFLISQGKWSNTIGTTKIFETKLLFCKFLYCRFPLPKSTTCSNLLDVSWKAKTWHGPRYTSYIDIIILKEFHLLDRDWVALSPPITIITYFNFLLYIYICINNFNFLIYMYPRFLINWTCWNCCW